MVNLTMLLESVSTMDFIGTKLADFLTYTGFANVEWANIIMIAVGAFFIWLAIAKDFEPLLLIPIGLGIILGNIPFKDAGLEIGLYEDNSVLNIFYQGVRQMVSSSCVPRHWCYDGLFSPHCQSQTDADWRCSPVRYLRSLHGGIGIRI